MGQAAHLVVRPVISALSSLDSANPQRAALPNPFGSSSVIRDILVRAGGKDVISLRDANLLYSFLSSAQRPAVGVGPTGSVTAVDPKAISYAMFAGGALSTGPRSHLYEFSARRGNPFTNDAQTTQELVYDLSNIANFLKNGVYPSILSDEMGGQLQIQVVLESRLYWGKSAGDAARTLSPLVAAGGNTEVEMVVDRLELPEVVDTRILEMYRKGTPIPYLSALRSQNALAASEDRQVIPLGFSGERLCSLVVVAKFTAAGDDPFTNASVNFGQQVHGNPIGTEETLFNLQNGGSQLYPIDLKGGAVEYETLLGLGAAMGIAGKATRAVIPSLMQNNRSDGDDDPDYAGQIDAASPNPQGLPLFQYLVQGVGAVYAFDLRRNSALPPSIENSTTIRDSGLQLEVQRVNGGIENNDSEMTLFAYGVSPRLLFFTKTVPKGADRGADMETKAATTLTDLA